MSESSESGSVFIDSAADKLADQGVAGYQIGVDVAEQQKRRKDLFQFIKALDALRDGLKQLGRRSPPCP